MVNQVKTKIGKGILLISALLLLTPFMNQLSNPFNNPNTPFEDYPEPFQQAFAESQVGTITRTKDQSTEIIAVNATHVTKKQVFGLTEFILVNGKYINAKVTEDANFVYVDARTPVKISKSTCELVELDKGRIADNLAARKTTDYTILTSDNSITWNNPLDAKTCNSLVYITNSTGTFVTATQTIGSTELQIIYAWYENQELIESFFIPKNNGISKYIAVKETQEVQNAIETLDFNTNKYVQVATGVKKIKADNTQVTNANHTETKQTTTKRTLVYEKQGSKPMVYDTSGAGEFFNSITISNDNGKLVTEILYTKEDTKLNAGQSYTIDPTFGYTTGTFTQPILEDCNVNWITNSARMVGGDTGSCYFVTEEWDTTSITDGSDVTNVNFRYDISAIDAGAPVCSAVTLSVQPSVSTLAQEGDAVRAGSVYAAIDCDNTQTQTVVDLGTTADTNVENLLTSNYFSLGLRKNPDDNAANRASFANNQLEVTYSAPVTQQVKFRLFESDGTTAVASASIIVKNSTATTTLTTNSTGVTPAIGLKSITNHNVTTKTSTNYVVYKQFNWQPTANQTETRTGNIFDVTGCSSTLSNTMMNDTDRHNVASVPLTPTCTSDVLTFNYFYKNLGMGSGGSNQTTTIRLEVPASSSYARSQTAYVNGTAIAMTYSAGVLTSGTIQVDNGANNVILKVRITFSTITPQPPVNPNVKLNGTTGTYQVDTLTVKWTPNNATWTTGYRIYNSTNNVSYSLTTSGLANGTTFYNHNIAEHNKLMYYKIYSEPYSAGNPPSTTVYNRTATFPSAPTSLTITTPAANQLKLTWLAGANDGNSTRKDCSIRFDNTTTGDTGGWVTEVTNSTIAGTCTNRQYTKSSINGGSSYTFQVREGNSQGWSSWSSNATGTVTSTTDITIRLFVERTGDTMKVTPHITFVSGQTDSGLPTLQSIRFYNSSAGTIINSTTLNKLFTSGMAQNFTAMYENMLGQQGSNYRMTVQVTNYTASGTVSTIENATISSYKGVYRASYFEADVPSQGNINYTQSRNSNQNLLTLVVNRDTTSTLFSIECNLKDQYYETGTWYNYTSVAWFNRSISVDARNSVVGTCYNDAQLFQFVSYNSLNGTLAITQYTESLGDLFGVPVIFLIVIFVAAVFTGIKAPVGVVVLGGTIGTMGVMGFWVDSSGNALLTAATWGFIILLVVLGMFTGKKFSG